ncbi:FAD-dependent oxidoreductase [Chryseolinea sp. T2]|uniref:FAD-dependent oxidoreductase n=1 Tax=Chryseolinea sp. T2 TaxID=3129255 RepID=UPI003077AEBF
MIIAEETSSRTFKNEEIISDLVVVGGGLSGACCAITAARQGIRVTLVQDRPVLGGNSSSEVRLWVLGATSHMGNNNRWAREGGVIDEILVENMYRNPEGNAVIFDTVVLDKVVSEPNIRLLLNTAVIEVEKSSSDMISSAKAFCSQNSMEYVLKAPLFCDASGDGVLGFLSGAAFRMGAESREEFGEKFAPTKEYGELLGHSLYFYSKDVGKPVNFVAPSYALKDITKIPKYRKFNSREYGCNLWWIEYGGRLDTVHETETIKWELWSVIYGVWNHIKNSGQFPEAKNLTLEWVGMIPGKRESRRFIGDYMLTQSDIVEQRTHTDAVAFGGWSIDLHPADGVFSEKPGCNQWHGKGIYQIPYRSYYSKNIKNLFLAGRIISVTHVAFGSSRVMATSAYGGQAVGMAAVLCRELNVLPAAFSSGKNLHRLQQKLMATGQHIPAFTLADEGDIARNATLSASSELHLSELPEGGLLKTLDPAVGQMLPLSQGRVPQFTVHLQSEKTTTLDVELRICSRPDSYTPDVMLKTIQLPITPGRNCIKLDFETNLSSSQYAFILFRKNPDVKLHFTSKRITGVLSVYNQVNEAVSNYGRQEPPEDIGIDAFEFWCPQRRPAGENVAIKIGAPLSSFGVQNLVNGLARPTNQPNAWVAGFADKHPSVKLTWSEAKTIKSIVLKFDTDLDHPMETVLMGHPENVMPFCVRNYTVRDDKNNVVHECKGNYQTINTIRFGKAVQTKSITLEVEHPSDKVPAAIFEILCYEK